MGHGQPPGLPQTNGRANLIPGPKINAVQMVDGPGSPKPFALYMQPTPLLLLLPELVLLFVFQHNVFNLACLARRDPHAAVILHPPLVCRISPRPTFG